MAGKSPVRASEEQAAALQALACSRERGEADRARAVLLTLTGWTSGHIKEFVPGGTKGKRGPRTDNRRFLDALLWMARSGGRRCDLPERLGDHRSVKRRYDRWIEMGVLDTMLSVLAREADLAWLMIDSTIVRAHRHAAGARQEKGGRMPRAWVGLGAG